MACFASNQAPGVVYQKNVRSALFEQPNIEEKSDPNCRLVPNRCYEPEFHMGF
jgi:hypothetical protein